MADNRTFERDARVEVYIDGQWLPALIKNATLAAYGGSEAFTYTVQVDLAGQPQFTNRPVRDYRLLKAVTADSLREVGGKGVAEPVDGYAQETTNKASAYAKFLGIPTAEEWRKKHGLKNDGMKLEDTDGDTLTTARQQAVRSDDDGNVTHGANASIQFVGDVTGTNGTGVVNANGEVPGAVPNTAVNETPYTVEASNDPHLGLHKTNLPNTGVEPSVQSPDGASDEVLTKTGNEYPVNQTSEKGKDGKVIASDKYDGAIASATPVGSKDDHEVASTEDEKQKYEAIDNPALNQGKVDPAKDADGTHGTTDTLFRDVADKTAKNAEKMTSDKPDQKETQQQADSTAKVQAATGKDNPQLPASKSDVTDGSVQNAKKK